MQKTGRLYPQAKAWGFTLPKVKDIEKTVRDGFKKCDDGIKQIKKILKDSDHLDGYMSCDASDWLRYSRFSYQEFKKDLTELAKSRDRIIKKNGK